ncbi:hypothetical protein [Okeania sp. KiyG1]|uniref:hypothetical protein n=1 Tax=Okeania sp. KiyG1 TaxID=2720165 RepID=UPI00192337CF|nr:hypothetical protein [Okeania sp. KiyG1]
MHYHLLSNSYFCAVPSDRYTQLKSQKLKVKSKNLGSVILLFWLCWMKVAFLISIAQLNRSVSRLLMHYHLLSNSYFCAVPSDRYTQLKSQKLKVKSKNLTRFSYSSVLALLDESSVLNIYCAA